MTQRARRWMSTVVRLAICVAAVTWLVSDIEWSVLRQVLAQADWKLVMVAVVAFGPAPICLAIRLKWLLHVHDIKLTTWQAMKVSFAGSFIINTLPVGTSGGDAVKAYYIARDTPHKHEAVTTVFFDRVIGVAGLVGLAGAVLLVNWRNPAFAGWGRVIAVMVLTMLAGGGAYFSYRARRLLHLDTIVSWLPFASHLQRIDRAAFAFRHRPGRLIACLAMAVVLQFICIVSVFLAGWALGMVGDRPLSDFPVYLGYTPICFLAGALPIGVMEATFKELFAGSAGLGSAEAAISLALISRLIQLIWALPGAIVVLRAGRPASGIAEIEDEPADQRQAVQSGCTGSPSPKPGGDGGPTRIPGC